MLDLRPHHILCAIGFSSGGPSAAFLDNVQAIRAHLESAAGRKVPIRLTHGVDALCAACPGRHGRVCDHADEGREADRLVCEALGLKEGDILPWGELRRRVVSSCMDARWDKAVRLCPWKEFGASSRGLEAFRAESARQTTGAIRRPT